MKISKHQRKSEEGLINRHCDSKAPTFRLQRLLITSRKVILRSDLDKLIRHQDMGIKHSPTYSGGGCLYPPPWIKGA